MNKTLMTMIALALSAGAAHAADTAKGEQKASQICAACHGKDGKTPIDPSYPILAGQHEDYLAQALHDYKSGARTNPIMGAQAKMLSSDDIDNVAAYFASLPSGLSHNK